MKYFFLFFFLTLSSQYSNADLLTDITDGKYKAKTIANLQSMKDGENYTILINNELIVKYNYKTGNVVDTVLNLGKLKKSPLSTIKGYNISPDETKLLVYSNPTYRYRRTFTADYYVYDIKRRELKPLSENGPQEVPLFSPDSKYIAFARENNLYLYKLDFGTESAITKDGEFGKIINGTPDWV